MEGAMALRFRSIAWALAAAGLLVACMPATDRDRYAAGDTGTATLRNRLATTLCLGGCGHFEYEKRSGQQWVSQGSDVVCVWEGFAVPVPPEGVVVDPITAREPGTWRLRYPVGVGCSETEPLSRCGLVKEVVSNEFEVVENGCMATGCSAEVCAEAPVATPCVWLPAYACYRDAHCGRFGLDGACAWQATPELAACLEEQAGNLSPKP
jgi:eight-cysteine-cluster-containing protein